MADRASVYAPLRFFPQAEHLAPFCPAAQIVVDAEAEKASITWPDLSLSLTRMPDEDMARHLQGLQGYVRERGANEALAIRVLSALSVYGISAEPAFDAEQRALGLVVGITQATMGLCYLEGDLLDEYGESLFRNPLKAPSASRVAARALALLAVAMRGLVEEDAGKPDELEAEAFRGRIVAFCDAHQDIAVELEPEEDELLRTPVGKADPQAVVDSVWRAEGAQVLLWALKQRELPGHDAQEHPFKVAKDSGVLLPERPSIFDANLRPSEEIDAMRLRLLALHWRMIEARIDPSRAVKFVQMSEKDFLSRADLTGFPLVDEDLAFQGEAVFKLSQSQIQLGQSIARERHHAANWLLGVNPIYSLVVTPT